MSNAPPTSAILAALDTVFATGAARVFPQVAPADTLPPYVVYGIVGAAPENTLNNGVPLDNWRYQVDVYAMTYAETQSLAHAVREAMEALSLPVSAIFLSQVDVYEDVVMWHRAICDFSIWKPRSS